LSFTCARRVSNFKHKEAGAAHLTLLGVSPLEINLGDESASAPLHHEVTILSTKRGTVFQFCEWSTFDVFSILAAHSAGSSESAASLSDSEGRRDRKTARGYGCRRRTSLAHHRGQLG